MEKASFYQHNLTEYYEMYLFCYILTVHEQFDI